MAAKLLFFWDYDTQWGADRSRTPGGAKDWGGLEFPNTERLLELHAAYNLPACFAVVGSVALPGERPYHDPAQVRHIHAAGHEIASHSHRHEWLPALAPAALRETLASSKDALEQCIGAAVTAFVPPFDMPMDYPQKRAFNRTERREAPHNRTDLYRLCATLKSCGYTFCRVSYRPLPVLLLEKLLGRRWGDAPRQVEDIAGLSCLRTNTPPGFAAPTLHNLEKFSGSNGYILVYGHPHHLSKKGSAESEAYLLPLFERVRDLRQSGHLEVITPRQLAPQSAASD